MTTKVRVKVANEHKKSFMEYNTWQCKLQYLKEEVEGDENESEVANQVQLEEGQTWIVMKEEIGWRWGSASVVMTKEEYENFDWSNPNDDFSFYDFEDAEFYEANDSCWGDYEFQNLHEDCDVDEEELYDLMMDYGDIEDCEYIIAGPVEHEIEEEWDE